VTIHDELVASFGDWNKELEKIKSSLTPILTQAGLSKMYRVLPDRAW
jgi:hypothetical protein